MKKPLRTGALFGLGFAVLFGGTLIGVLMVASSIEEGRSSIRKAEMLESHLPTVVRADPVVRNGQLIVLITVRNDSDDFAGFLAEAVLFDKFGQFYDTCSSVREHSVAPGKELHFKAPCPIYGLDQSEVLESLGPVEVQFRAE